MEAHIPITTRWHQSKRLRNGGLLLALIISNVVPPLAIAHEDEVIEFERATSPVLPGRRRQQRRLLGQRSDVGAKVRATPARPSELDQSVPGRP